MSVAAGEREERIRRREGRLVAGAIAGMEFKGTDVAGDIRAKYGDGGDLLRLYAGHRGKIVNKWHHYIPVYERYFGSWRARPLRFLEIGVFRGGSLQMWREYFGAEAVIFGIDIDPDCAAHDGDAGRVRIGSQVDRDFLMQVVDEMGGVDVVLDDGSHHMDHVTETLRMLWPRLSLGGLYMIEDMHAAYWPPYGGGHGHRANFFNRVREMADDMHQPYHGKGPNFPELSGSLAGVHLHDSIVVLDKAAVYPPTHSRVE